MRLLLTAAGITTAEIAAACVGLCGKDASAVSVAVVNEAYAVEDGDKRWVLDDLNRVADTFGGDIDLVNVLALPAAEVLARLAAKDMVFVVGGHADYLMHVLRRTGLADSLPDLLGRQVYVGSSAGSMILGRRTSAAVSHTLYNEAAGYGVDAYLGVVDFAVLPHLGSPDFPANRADVLAAACAELPITVYGMSDDSAILVDGTAVTFLGTPPVRAGRRQAADQHVTRLRARGPDGQPGSPP